LEVALGGEVSGQLGLTGTLITNPNSPDFLKASANPILAISGGLKEGAGQTFTVATGKLVGGVSITGGEFFGPSSGATIGSLEGHSGGAYLGVEAKVGIGLAGSGVASVAIPQDGLATWAEAGVDITGEATPSTVNATGEIGLGYQYTGKSFGQVDLMAGFMRPYHTRYANWVQSGRTP
jgi:hypothetical protein